MFCLFIFAEWESRGFPSLVAGSACMLWFFIACLVIWLPTDGKACVLPFGGCVVQFSGMQKTNWRQMATNLLTIIIWVISGLIIAAYYIRCAIYLYPLNKTERQKKIRKAIPTLSVTLFYILFWLPCVALASLVRTGYPVRADAAYMAQCLTMINAIMCTVVYGITNESYRESFTQLCSIRQRRTIPVNYPAAKAKEQRRGMMHDRSKTGSGSSSKKQKRANKIAVKPIVIIPDF